MQETSSSSDALHAHHISMAARRKKNPTWVHVRERRRPGPTARKKKPNLGSCEGAARVGTARTMLEETEVETGPAAGAGAEAAGAAVTLGRVEAEGWSRSRGSRSRSRRCSCNPGPKPKPKPQVEP